MKGGTGAMTGTRYRRGQAYAADMAVYARLMAQDNREELSQLQRNLARALGEDVTARQRQVLLLYYAQGMTMGEIAQELGEEEGALSRRTECFPCWNREIGSRMPP